MPRVAQGLSARAHKVDRQLGDEGTARTTPAMAGGGHASEGGRRERPLNVCAPPGAAGEW